MAYTTGTIVPKVQNRVRDTGYSTSEIKQYLTDTARDVFNEYPSLPLWKATADFTVTAGNSDLTASAGLPSNYGVAEYLVNTTDGQEIVIPYVEQADLDLLYPDTNDQNRYANGTPLACYFDGTTLRLFPAPASAYTLRLHYYKEPAELSNDSDVPDVPQAFEELLVVGAAYRVLQVKGVYDEAGILENKYQELLQKLVDKSIRVPTVRIMKSSRGLSAYYPLDSYRRIP